MSITLLEKRTIEADALAPVLKAFARELGQAKVNRMMIEINTAAARRYGCDLARKRGSATLADLAGEIQNWAAGNSLEMKVLEISKSAFCFDVTRCRFAEAYEQLGIKGFGVALSCCRDFGFIEGFNPAIKLVRTQTIMESAPICDFRFHIEPDEKF